MVLDWRGANDAHHAEEPCERLVLVELADHGQGEHRAHVLEVRANLHADPVPTGFAFDVFDDDLGFTQRTTSADVGRRVVVLDHIL